MIRYYCNCSRLVSDTEGFITRKIFDTADSTGALGISAGKVKRKLSGIGSATFTIPVKNSYASTLKSMAYLGSEIVIHRVYGSEKTDDVIFIGHIKRIERDIYGNLDITCTEILEELDEPYYYNLLFRADGVVSAVMSAVHYQNYLFSEKKKWGVMFIAEELPEEYIIDLDYLDKPKSALDIIDDIQSIADTAYGDELVYYVGENFGSYRYWLTVDVKNTLSIGSQKIEFGKNIIDISFDLELPEATIIRCEYKDENDNDVTFSGWNNASNLAANTDFVKRGVTSITDIVNFGKGDMTSGQLKEKAQAYIDALCEQYESFEVKALDMSAMDDSVVPFSIGTKVQVISTKHGIDTTAPIAELNIDLCNPLNNTITVGGKYRPRITG